jgi:MraZ protein
LSGGFRGAHKGNVDDKARVVIPVPYRPFVKDRIVLMCGADAAIYGMAKEQWDAMLEREAEREETWSLVLRRLIATAVDVQIDQSFRVVLPELHMRHAKLVRGDRTMILGLGSRFEIHKADSIETYLERFGVSALVESAVRSTGLKELM